MFDIGFWELVLIGIVALFSVGPERLPGFAREAGQWISRLRRILYTARREIKNELDLLEKQDLKTSLDDLDDLMRNAPDRQEAKKQPPPAEPGDKDAGQD